MRRLNSVDTVIVQFAALRMTAIFGKNNKARGFWIYGGYRTRSGFVPGVARSSACILNDGVNSGSPVFWTMADALSLLAQIADSSQRITI